jgi:hypothetical protein
VLPLAPPRSLRVAALAVALTLVGLTLWTVALVDDALRSRVSSGYAVASVVALAVLAGLTVADVLAMGWLWSRGRGKALALTVTLLLSTSFCCGLPGLVVGLVSGGWPGAEQGSPAAPWVRLLLAAGAGLATLSSFAAALALMTTSSRAYVGLR